MRLNHVQVIYGKMIWRDIIIVILYVVSEFSQKNIPTFNHVHFSGDSQDNRKVGIWDVRDLLVFI